MKLALFIFLLGIMFIIAGYTHQKTPTCDSGTQLKLVNRDEFNRINDVGGVNSSHLGSPL
tara:strand:+ start:490 stop:669 length:180 start_codon:yes stop_codon:yes gene_type:complete